MGILDEVGALPTCTSCRYWAQSEEGRGLCRYDPPVIRDDGQGAWPLTLSTDWCGFHER